MTASDPTGTTAADEPRQPSDERETQRATDGDETHCAAKKRDTHQLAAKSNAQREPNDVQQAPSEDDNTSSGLADRVTMRRRPVLSLLGVSMSAVAGCSTADDETRGGSEQDTNQPEGRSDDDTATDELDDHDEQNENGDDRELADDIATLIADHVEAIDATSYTLEIEYQGELSSPETVKEIEYRSDQERDVVALIEASTLNDRVDRLSNYYRGGRHTTVLTFNDGEQVEWETEEALPEIMQISGESLFRQFLAGATLGEPTAADHSNGDLATYPVESHRRFDLETGSLTTTSDNVIDAFRLAWTDSDGDRRWIDVETHGVGDTTVDSVPTR